MSKVVKLPRSSPTYIRVRRYGRQWCIYLVTPCEGGTELKTKLGSHPRREAAIEYAQFTGKRLHRPVQLSGEAAP
jgi:hypothetical protein